MSEAEPAVLVPAGEPLLDAAGWVGASCRAELDLHDRLTEVLAAGSGPGRTAVLWQVRAHRAELAEGWHRRLPELREMPRSGFVEGATLASGRPADDPTDVSWLIAALDGLLERYRERVAVAVGPADGPTADTLQVAIARTEEDRAAVAAL